MDDNSSQSNDLVEIVDESQPPSPPPRSLSPACIRRHKRLNEPDVYCLAPAAIEASSSQVLNEQLVRKSLARSLRLRPAMAYAV